MSNSVNCKNPKMYAQTLCISLDIYNWL